jgi:hypothetical protein
MMENFSLISTSAKFTCHVSSLSAPVAVSPDDMPPEIPDSGPLLNRSYATQGKETDTTHRVLKLPGFSEHWPRSWLILLASL